MEVLGRYTDNLEHVAIGCNLSKENGNLEIFTTTGNKKESVLLDPESAYALYEYLKNSYEGND